MMTSIEEVNLRVSYQAQVRKQESKDFYTQLHDARTDRRDIRLEIDVVRGQRTANETELHETHMSRMEWQRQGTEDFAVRQMMRTQVLEARARIDTMEDAGRTHDAMTPESIQAMIDRAIQRNSTQDDGSQSSGGGIRRPVQPYSTISGCALKSSVVCYCTLLDNFKIELWILSHGERCFALLHSAVSQELALMCTKFLADETANIDKYIGGLPDNIHGNVMSARPKTLDFAIELANDLMDQKLHIYAERQNDNKRKANDSSRNNQQPHEKQNVARAYTAGPSEKKAYTGTLPLCTKCNYHHTGQCVPKCGNCKRYGHATNDCWVNTNNNNNNNNNNKNQKAGECYECGKTGHIKKNCPKLKNRRNNNGNGTTQGRAYALGESA
ncbi:putative reverse transcriptase domain-containing protein [Tanacetum coccineum]